ncbi:unnamed protein product [Rotaria sordida]|uniref:PNPLA domain-containing protein n=2 Tax=Rotaria sordida TaxID=392033 RepID=A0A815M4C4_9BILA|nr:unnamed protein product [Rotaria sordida]
MSLNHAEPKSEHYNILSIDGGGMRGLIPAIWMSELEQKTGLSSSSMFHMMAGTSTGAIITASLSLPDKPGSRQPRFRATDVVELYTTKSERIFTRASWIQKYSKTLATYTADGRNGLFDEYFGDARLSQALTDLVITTTQLGSDIPVVFHRNEILMHKSKDYKLTDILMCTTAAPTFFPSYQLDDCTFVDGALQANNPVQIAYTKAHESGGSHDNIFILSLGTGDCISDPSNPNKEKSLLFWQTDYIQDVLTAVYKIPQNNTHNQLSQMFNGNQYHRWQVWLENSIALDDISKKTLEKLMNLAHAYFEEMDNLDNNNRLGKIIERLKGQ